MKKKSEIGFKLVNIRTEQFATFIENYTTDKSINFSSSLSFKLNNKAKMVGSFVNFTFSHQENPIIKIEVSCHFKIQNDAWNVFIEKEPPFVIIPKGFLAHLAMLTIGTSRGILFAKTEGTEFSKFILPTIDVTTLVKKDAKFEIKNAETI